MPGSACASDVASYKLIPQNEPEPGGADGGEGAGGQVGRPPGPRSYVDSLLHVDQIDGSRPLGFCDVHFWIPKTCNPGELIDSVAMSCATVLLIMINAIVIGFETDSPNMLPWSVIENVFLFLFTAELALRLLAFGPTKFFTIENNPDITWNVFDFAIVAIGIINVVSELIVPSESGGAEEDAMLFRMVRLLRILRVLRIIRIVRFLKQLYLLAYGFTEGAMAVFWVSLLASFVLYICSVILVRTYGRTSDASENDFKDFFHAHFGTIPASMFSLFELICAPDLRPYKEIMFTDPVLSVFLVTFIILGSFGINGLLVALINESILEKNMARNEAQRIERETKRKFLQQRCREIFDARDMNKNRVLRREDLMECKPQIASLFETLGVNFRSHDLDQMFYVMDVDDTGIIERTEFVQGVVELCDQIRPMSIMELHYQVSKCTSKISESDSKVEGLVKSVEDVAMIRSMDVERARGLVADLNGLLGVAKGGIGLGLGQRDAPLPGAARRLAASEVSESAELLPLDPPPVPGGGSAASPRPQGHAALDASVTLQPLSPTSPKGGGGSVPLQSHLAEYRRTLEKDQSRIDRCVRDIYAESQVGEPSPARLLELASAVSGLSRANDELIDALLREARDSDPSSLRLGASGVTPLLSAGLAPVPEIASPLLGPAGGGPEMQGNWWSMQATNSGHLGPLDALAGNADLGIGLRPGGHSWKQPGAGRRHKSPQSTWSACS